MILTERIPDDSKEGGDVSNNLDEVLDINWIVWVKPFNRVIEKYYRFGCRLFVGT